MTAHLVGESSLSKRFIGILWQTTAITDKLNKTRSQQVRLQTQSSVLMLGTAFVPSGYMVLLRNVHRAVVVYGPCLQAFAEFSGKHGAQAETAMVRVHATDVTTSKVQAAATTIVK
jgi:hypothetical protein